MGPEEPHAVFSISINKLMCGDYIGSDHFSYIRVCLQIQGKRYDDGGQHIKV